MNLDELVNQIQGMEQVIAKRTAELKTMKQALRKLRAALDNLRSLGAQAD